MLIAGGACKTVQLWQLPTGRPLASLTHTGEHTGQLAVTPDGKLLASGDGDLVRLWHLPSGEPAGVLRGPEGLGVSRLVISPDGTWLASGNEGGTVQLWRLPTGTPGGSLAGNGTPVKDVVFTLDGSALAVASSGALALWPFRHAAGAEEDERTWAALIAGLVRWRRRHDIELSAGTGPDETDIELGHGQR